MGPVHTSPTASPPTTLQIDEVSIRELEASAEAMLSWPYRWLHAWPLFVILFIVALSLLEPLLGQGRWAVAVPVGYLAVVMLSLPLASDRRYVRVWRDEPRPEPGRLFRRLYLLGSVVIGLLLMAIAAAHLFLDGRTAQTVTRIAGKLMGPVGVAAMASSWIWSARRHPGAWKGWTGGLGVTGGQVAAAVRGVYEPSAEWTTSADPRVVALARATRSLWRNNWIVNWPARWLVFVLVGWLGRLLTFQPGRGAALVALAQRLGGTMVRNDETTILDWLDQRGWGPAPHVPAAWIGTRVTVVGAHRGVPVAVSVVYRLANRIGPDLKRTHIFVAAPRDPGQGPSPALMAAAARHGYSAQVTRWGTVFTGRSTAGQAVAPAVVGDLVEAALA